MNSWSTKRLRKILTELLSKLLSLFNKKTDVDSSESFNGIPNLDDKTLKEELPTKKDIVEVGKNEEDTESLSVLTLSRIISEQQLKQIMPNLSDEKCREYLPYLFQAMDEFEINTPIRIAAFIAQTAHESAEYTSLIENLNYSADALMRVWPSRFTPEKVTSYARQPEKIANCVYANRMDNGDELSGDGWRYRGRGVIQITGRYNYEACGTALKLDLVSKPELLEQPLNTFRSAAWYWASRKLNALADNQDFKGITRGINGGLNGLEDRIKYYNRAKAVLNIS